jgi:CRISPR/Cas system-associated endonuclease Cas1
LIEISLLRQLVCKFSSRLPPFLSFLHRSKILPTLRYSLPLDQMDRIRRIIFFDSQPVCGGSGLTKKEYSYL